MVSTQKYRMTKNDRVSYLIQPYCTKGNATCWFPVGLVFGFLTGRGAGARADQQEVVLPTRYCPVQYYSTVCDDDWVRKYSSNQHVKTKEEECVLQGSQID